MLPQHLLEKSGRTDISYLEKNADPYSYFREKHIEIQTHDATFAGIYRGMTSHGKLVLQPHLMHTPLSLEEQKKYQMNTILEWNDQLQFISENPVLAVYPRTEEYFSNLILKRQIPKDLPEDYSI